MNAERYPSPDPKRWGKLDWLVELALADGRGRFVRVPVEELTLDAIQKALAEQTAGAAELIGQQVKGS